MGVIVWPSATPIRKRRHWWRWPFPSQRAEALQRLVRADWARDKRWLTWMGNFEGSAAPPVRRRLVAGARVLVAEDAARAAFIALLELSPRRTAAFDFLRGLLPKPTPEEVARFHEASRAKERARRLRAAKATLARHERGLKLKQTLVKKWRRRVAALERALAQQPT